MKQSIEKLRLEYGNTPLLESNINPDPMIQFNVWLEEAIEAKVMEPNGMVLATASQLGAPSSRTVLLKELDPKGGFVFYTHYTSRKGQQLSVRKEASLTFWWKEIYRQVNIEGKVEKLSRKASIAYFEKRPRGAELAAIASKQSEPLASREELDETYSLLEEGLKGKKVPCPKTWGGYCLIPERMEFWQGRSNRLHDRFLFVRADGEWIMTRLSP